VLDFVIGLEVLREHACFLATVTRVNRRITKMLPGDRANIVPIDSDATTTFRSGNIPRIIAGMIVLGPIFAIVTVVAIGMTSAMLGLEGSTALPAGACIGAFSGMVVALRSGMFGNPLARYSVGVMRTHGIIAVLGMGLDAAVFVGAGIGKHAGPLVLILLFLFGGFCGLVLGMVAGVTLTALWAISRLILKSLFGTAKGQSLANDRSQGASLNVSSLPLAGEGAKVGGANRNSTSDSTSAR
jgi:hypothetical protein